MDFNCLHPTIVFQEVPQEISLCFSITGCRVGCKGCHSTELWDPKQGEPLSNQRFTHWIERYQGLISCVLFFGGEWQPKTLIEKLHIAKSYGLKTCLYSGEQHVDMAISSQLDFLKTGRWVPELGGLDSPRSNQVFRDMHTLEKLNHLFITSPSHTSIAGADNVAA
ncbi:anaerobic ribonucleoside-triphosphate reductase activating protein [Shewanella waksmanii]|uniref:anaerobic ribonucleoside-triphosphate reductase activating protein n=1 Tax=Shewanella waksmanii TaxID=213783 RepID=UPI0037368574